MNDNSYPKHYRLLKPADYRHPRDSQKKIKSHYFIIGYKDNGLSNARLGIIITKRCAKLATVRNQLKRIIRESFRHCCHNLPNVDCIVIVKQTIHSIDTAQFRTELDKKWRKLQ